MGCDIHMVMERRDVGGSEWVGLWCSDRLPGVRGRPKVCQRDYSFFSRFGVRGSRNDGNVIYPRNLPIDPSRLAWVEYMSAPTDHHSVSHATPQEIADAWLAENPDDPDVRPEFALYDLFSLDADWPENVEYRVVFWFDN